MQVSTPTMLLVERQREISKLILRDGSVRVSRLAQLFQVTEETIRRDLDSLESNGTLLRSHGGAVLRTNGRESPFSERQVTFVEQKQAIARAAVNLIKPEDTIAMDASTTALELIRLVPDMPLTIITNAILVCTELANRKQVHVVCTGGTLSPASLSFVGTHSKQFLRDYHVNHLFFSCTGIDLQFGLSDVNDQQAVLKRDMISLADNTHLLADHSKFGVRALRRFASASDVSHIITDMPETHPSIIQLHEGGVMITHVSTPGAETGRAA